MVFFLTSLHINLPIQAYLDIHMCVCKRGKIFKVAHVLAKILSNTRSLARAPFYSIAKGSKTYGLFCFICLIKRKTGSNPETPEVRTPWTRWLSVHFAASFCKPTNQLTNQPTNHGFGFDPNPVGRPTFKEFVYRKKSRARVLFRFAFHPRRVLLFNIWFKTRPFCKICVD